jgi:Ca-activated chloride channel family protein
MVKNNGPMAQWLNGSILKSAVSLLIMIIVSATANGQTSRYINQGNKLYEEQRYKEAAADYSKALAKDPTNTPGLFNLGNSLYQQKQYDSSRKILEATAKMASNSNGKAAANYNIGNTYMSQQKWEDAAGAYKQTLRNNPQDGDAKYNLSYAEEMLKKQQQQQNKDKKQDKQNKDQKDKDKQQQQNKDQDKKDKQDKDKQPQDNKDQKDNKDKQQQQPESQPSKLSQQQADQLLNALQQEEKKLQDKMKKEKGVPVKMQKDW